MGNSLPQTVTELKAILQGLDKALLEKALKWAKECYEAILEAIDEAIAEHRSKELVIVHLRTVWYQTCLGPVKVRRRQYQDRQGKYRYLLDELLGMEKHSHITLGVQALSVELATMMPYRRAGEVLHKLTAIDLAHQTIHRLMGKVADPYQKKTENEQRWFMETGEIPKGEGKRVARLITEADGVMLSLQREKEKKAEVKLGIAYEGWEKVSKDRYRTVNKTVFTGVMGETAFWAGMTLKLQKKYDLSSTGQTIVGGDGARWVKEGADYMGGQFQLDRYHLNRELTTALGRDKETKNKVWQACQCGHTEAALQIISEAAKAAKGEQAQKIGHAYNYMWENRWGLVDYRLALGDEGQKLRHTGAIEGNVDKIIARRMKNQGMSWTVKGIKRLLCIRLLVFEGKLTEWLAEKQSPGPQISITGKKVRRLVNHLSIQEPDDWLKAGLPALRGPHASHPWVQILRSLSEAQPL